MKNFNGWRRTVVAAVLSVAATALGLGPARPAVAVDRSTCGWTQQVYGVTPSGALVQHEYCMERDRRGLITARQITAPGWATGGEIFSGGYIKGSDVFTGPRVSVIYQVSRNGTLLWYSDQDGARPLGQGVPVGAAFGDWRRFRSLMSRGGQIHGIDPAGRVLRWRHLGWQDGSDVWAGPEIVGTRFGRSRRIVAVTITADEPKPLFVGVDNANPRLIRFWRPDGTEVCERRRRISGTAGSGPLTFGVWGKGYGRSRTGRILFVEATRSDDQNKSVWVASELDTARFTRVFAGDAWQVFGGGPYEWQ